ncbi:MAG: DUF4926 domain-containing protein [Acidobacteriia bacterium]|nr:DUF4926 domain-containing protein [Terriglobia bacterium]
MLYTGDTVRLLRELPEPALAQGCEGTVVEIQRSEEGYPLAAVVQFHGHPSRVTAAIPMDALELVIDSVGPCTAVFWGLILPPEEVVEGCMHAMMDHGHEMRGGLNVQRLRYDAEERFWRREEKLRDASGAHVATSAPVWDGCLVAFSGWQRLHLEFRLHGRRPPYLLLHERYEPLEEQRRTTQPAMTLLRLMASIYNAAGADYAAIPVADNWVVDESFDSLLKPPYFPDLFLLPQASIPEPSAGFRIARLTNGKAILTALPVKFSPVDVGFQRTEEELKLNRMRASEALGEKAYDQLYETRPPFSPSTLYSDAKESFYHAISLAGELGLTEQAERLSKRLEHIKAVFRSQFS